MLKIYNYFYMYVKKMFVVDKKYCLYIFYIFKVKLGY